MFSLPTYGYRCLLCGHEFEIKQGFHDPALTNCPITDCNGETRRMISPVGVIFKGSGWYVNDYGKKNSAMADSNKPSSENSSEGSKDAPPGSSKDGSPGSTIEGASTTSSKDKNTASGTPNNS